MFSSELVSVSPTGGGRLLRLLLGEPFLGFLAIIAAALTLIPLLFTVSPRTEALCTTGQWVIIGWYTAEYVLALAWSADRWAFLKNPWRLVDVAIVALPFLTLVPQTSAWLRSSPLLRLFRLVRLLTLGLRASGIVMRAEAQRAVVAVPGPVQVSVVRTKEADRPRPVSWEEFLQWVKAPDEEWYHVSNLGQELLGQAAAAAGIPVQHLESNLLGAAYPHLESGPDYAVLFLWLPQMRHGLMVDRTGVLAIVAQHGFFTLSQRPAGLSQAATALNPRPEWKDLPFPVRMVCVLTELVVRRNEEIVRRLEKELAILEELPVRESRPQFFEESFRLKKELSAAQADLWRLKGILDNLGAGRVTLPGGGSAERPILALAAEDADYLYETVVNTREGLLSLLDLHLNVVSFEMNRVMRVLAVVSCLGLIPTVIGGLFGMNLADNPWPFTLAQVAFGVVLGMVLCLYFFVIKGWLR